MIKRRALCCEAAGLAAQMLIVYRAIDQLTPDPANPRRHSKKQIRQIAESIRIFGFQRADPHRPRGQGYCRV